MSESHGSSQKSKIVDISVMVLDSLEHSNMLSTDSQAQRALETFRTTGISQVTLFVPHAGITALAPIKLDLRHQLVSAWPSHTVYEIHMPLWAGKGTLVVLQST
jgi:hypothetical protein